MPGRAIPSARSRPGWRSPSARWRDGRGEPQGHFALATALAWQRELDRALVHARRCLALSLNSSEGHLSLAHVQNFLGDAAAAAALEQRLERNPHSETTYALLASSYGHLGRVAESGAAWEKTLELEPDFSLERRRRIPPFHNPEDFERRIEGLRKAGLPV